MDPLGSLLISSPLLFTAAWNLLNKQASGHATLTWLVAVGSAILYTPMTIACPIVVWNIEIHFIEVGLMAQRRRCIRLFSLLNQDTGCDLSLVYPLARGTGPLLSSLAAIVFFSAAAVGFGPWWYRALILTGRGCLASVERVSATGNTPGNDYARSQSVHRGLQHFGDKQRKALRARASVFDWGANLGAVIVLTPFADSSWASTRRAEWARASLRSRSVIAALVAGRPTLIPRLTAMQLRPVS